MTTIQRLLCGALAAAALLLASPAQAKEKDDLKREIDTHRAQAADLERLDEKHAVTDETTVLRMWLDEASAEHSKDEFNVVREVLDRIIAQEELIRQKIAASKITAQADTREAALKKLRDAISSTKKTLDQSTVNKKAMETTNK